MKDNIALSVLDVEKKYQLDYEEQTYSDNQIVAYGKDNNAPILYLNCYRQSATLGSIINGNVNYILGDGVEVNDCAANFKDAVNRKMMTMRQFVANLALSYEIYGGFAFQIIYSKIGVPVEFYPLDYARCRTNESGTKIFYSKKNWTKYSTKSEVFDAFGQPLDPNKLTQIYYYKGDFTTTVYPLPPYYGALKDILTEIECTNYSLNSVSNGFSARYIITLPYADNLTDEQKSDIETAIKNKFCGTEAEANFMIYYPQGDNDIKVTKIETDEANEKYVSVKENARQNIFTSLRCTPALFGLPNATTGFNSQEYDSAFKLYQKTVIDPIRDIIKEAIDKATGIKNAITITPFVIEFED